MVSGETEAVSSTEEESEGRDGAHSATELVEQLGRGLGALALWEARLETSRNAPGARRAAVAAGGAVVAAIALLTAFVFVNVAAVHGLSAAIPAWSAALVLAAAWAALGTGLLLVFAGRARHLPLWSVFAHGSAESLAALEQSRDDAIESVRETLERLGPALAVEIASAAIPAAGDIAGSVVGGADDLLEASDEIVESIAAEIPAGGVVNQIWDVALMPGRFGLRVATTVLRRDGSAR